MVNRLASLAVGLLLVFATAATTSAQTDLGIRLGYDTEFRALVFGGEARFPVQEIEDFPLVGNPSIEYYLIDRYDNRSEAMVEANGNAYYEFELEDRDDLVPYAGGGLGLRYYYIEDTALPDPSEKGLDIIVNLVGGATYNPGDPISPFGHLRLSLGGGTSTVGIIAGILFDL